MWLTGRTQRGSLAFYLFVILTMAILTPLSALILFNAPVPQEWYLADSPAQLIAGVVVILGALAALRANKRFMAVIMVGLTGYGIALIFALQGAPDLALTQLLVETIVLVAFVLALRSLPARLWQRETGRKYRVLRAVLGISFGLVMAAIAWRLHDTPRPAVRAAHEHDPRGWVEWRVLLLSLLLPDVVPFRHP